MFSSENWFGASAGFFNGVATQSLRFNDDDDAYLSRTPSSATNRKTWTYSTWFKIANTSASQTLLSAGSSGTGRVALYMSGGKFITDLGGTGTYDESVALFRDPSAWYHLVWAFDTTQATGANRSRIYINGTEITLTKTRTWSSNTNYAVNNNTLHVIGGFANVPVAFSSDAYHAETNFVDGTQLTPSSFGETKNGVWIPIEYTGSYGTNGFRLQFASTTHDAPASEGDAETDNIGADSSGENNHWTASDSIGAEDCNMPDSPENNFCTWNPLSNTGVTLSEGNLQTSGGASHVCGGTMAVTSGKWYWECKLKSTVNGSNPVILGFVSANTIAHANNFEQGVYFYTDNESNKTIVHVENNSATQTITVPSAMLPIAVDEVMQYAYDGDTGKIWFGIENVWADNSGGTTGNPSTGANPTFTLADTSIFMTPLRDHAGVAWTGLANFGQLDNDYTAPTDFNSLSTSNLPEPTIGSNSSNGTADEYFNTVLWTGNSSNPRSITGVGFQPDFGWHKPRNIGLNHLAWDSSRGASTNSLLTLFPNLTNDESNSLFSQGNATSLDSDGFTVNAGSSGDNHVNDSSYNYVAWNWKANGGTTSSNTDGSITSTVQANTDAGFSIVTYTGTGANATVGHGIGVAPRMIIMKNRDSSQNWVVYHEEIGNDREILLNSSGGQTNSNSVYFQSTSPTSTVFSLGSDNYANASTDDYVAYCFASIEGYSKIGSYTGNGDPDGTFVFTGFRPAWVMTKSTGSGNWYINDSARSFANPTSSFGANLYADLPNGESGNGMDILSSGFKIRNTDGSQNTSGQTYIYMAFAEAPFKYANAR